ncbi:molybdopterin-dependent oxidoreductase [Amaricoccus macauensis]|uniref:molybdopterin-dependent oxidoreductase n=1 Tax=Amaricoccus macauensis TaxID=57001 RepID=UPI003C7E19BD
MSCVRTTCPYCGVGCGVLATPDGQGGATIQGDPDHPANFGRLCSKGSALGETLDLEDRLLEPRIAGTPARWDAALDLMASKMRAAIETHGPDSVAIYASGQILSEDYYVANKLMKGFVGTGNIDTNSRLCMASSVAGHKRAFGTDTVPGTYEDLELADTVVLVGSNLAWCHPVIYQRIAAAKAERPGMKVVVIDPRRTATCDIADMHLRVRPDTDSALFNGLLARIQDLGALDADYVNRHVSGASEALDAASTWTREKVAETCGLSNQEVDAFFKLWIGREKVVTVFSQGVNQSGAGTDKVNAIINCHLATGRIGRAGMGPFSVTGQPNAMGGREVGGLANMLAAHLDMENLDHRNAVADFWRAPNMAVAGGLKAVDLFKACAEGRIKFLWIISTNPVVSMPDADAVSAAIRACDFVVVSDTSAVTDTMKLAHVQLPAVGWGEKSGTVTNSERRISRQRAFLPHPGEAKPDWWAITQLAHRLGWGDAFPYESPADIFREHAGLSGVAAKMGRDFDIGALSDVNDADYADMDPVQWPVGGSPRFFAKGGFFTADGRGRMLPITPPEVDRAPGLRLNTGRVRDQWHTMTRTGKSPRLSAHLAEPFAEIHPSDATARGIDHADLIRVSNARGTAIVRALVTDRTAPGEIFVPMHWTAQFSKAGRVGPLVPPVTDPFSGQPALKAGRAEVARLNPAWHGFAISRKKPDVGAIDGYWALAKSEGCWRAELAGENAPEDWEALARTMFGAPDAQLAIVSDPRRGITRIALIEDGIVVAALFAGPEPVEVSRAHALTAFAASNTGSLLAGRAGADQPDVGPIVCVCFNVGVNTIMAAIESGEACSVAEIGTLLSAGTNCGSCRPELNSLLAKASQKVAAE